MFVIVREKWSIRVVFLYYALRGSLTWHPLLILRVNKMPSGAIAVQESHLWVHCAPP